MARAQFWDQFNLSTTVLSDIWQAAQSRDRYLDDPFTFRGKTYNDILALYRVENGTEWWFEQYGTNITLDANGVITGGSITAIANWFREPNATSSFYSSFIDNFSVNARSFTNALVSTSTLDDIALFRQILSKSDTVRMSAFDDDFFGWTGNDTIRGGSGNDTLSGDAGNDSLLGEAGNDVLSGGSDNDILIGGRGRDVLTGGSGVDRFVFDSTSFRDRVTDFEDGIDRIVISSGAERMADLTITGSTAGVTVAFGTVQILLSGETTATITAADFLFT